MPVPDRVVHQYLSRYAEPEAQLVGDLAIGHYSSCLVVPAFRENWSDIEQALQHLPNRFLLILVVNAPTPDEQTSQLLTTVRNAARSRTSKGQIDYLTMDGHFDILLVDRCTADNGIPAHQGVGLARKIGADIACSLMFQGRIQSDTLYSTDADVILPPDYFTVSATPDDVAATLYPFRHIFTPTIRTAALLYEIGILYYVAQLKRAGSAYAFCSLGSTLAINVRHYVRVRGFPRRNAAEDFYLINKLAKSGRIVQARKPFIVISSRASDRVPFGTGPGIARIATLPDPVAQHSYYDAVIFDGLAELHHWLANALVTNEIGACSRPVAAFIEHADVMSFLRDRQQQNSDPSYIARAVHDWFDGFRTLKFVHFLRDEFYPSVPLARIVEAADLPSAIDSDDNLILIRDALACRCFGTAVIY